MGIVAHGSDDRPDTACTQTSALCHCASSNDHRCSSYVRAGHAEGALTYLLPLPEESDGIPELTGQ